MRKMFKKLMATVLVGIMAMSGVSVPANAAENDTQVVMEDENDLSTVTDAVDEIIDEDSVIVSSKIERIGGSEFVINEVSNTGAESIHNSIKAELDSDYQVIKGSAYSQYTCEYFYEQLTEDEKSMYDQLRATCERFITTTADIAYDDYSGEYFLDDISFEGLSFEDAKKVYYMFYFNNSQYYFLHGGFWYNSYYEELYPQAYPLFTDGSSRAIYTQQIFNVVENYVAKASTYATPYKKMLYVYKALSDDIKYVSNDYDQILYSPTMLKKTVCTGYSRITQVVANRLGIRTICVTSVTHCWNNVEINGKWYEMDTTWGDTGTNGKYDMTYFLNSESAVKSGNSDHGIEDYLIGYTPYMPSKYDTTAIDVYGITITSSTNTAIAASMNAACEAGTALEYQWLYQEPNSTAYKTIKSWNTSNQVTWTPPAQGDYTLVCRVRKKGYTAYVESTTPCAFHKVISGVCQMPYAMVAPGEPGYLIGITAYPGTAESVEMLILDCTSMQWVYATGKCPVNEANENCCWTVWQPQYGYYWTLFRAYDADGNLIDEICYGFVNAY